MPISSLSSGKGEGDMQDQIVKDITRYYVWGIVLLTAAKLFMIQYVDENHNSFPSLIAIILACLLAGAAYAKRSKDPIPKNEMISIARRGATVVTTMNGILIILYAILVNMVGVEGVPSTITWPQLLMQLGGVFILSFLTIRFMLPKAIKSQWKAIERKHRKAI
ncbi:MAG: ABZJ_00895 family protein [Pseudomonadota bacterium]